MSLKSAIDDMEWRFASIKVIGVGTTGCFAVNHIVAQEFEKIDLIAMHYDDEILAQNQAHSTLQIGDNIQGQVTKALKDAEMVVILSGLEDEMTINVVETLINTSMTKEILTVAVHVQCNSQASDKTLRELLPKVSSLIVIPNRQIINADDVAVSNDTILDRINDAYYQAVYGVTILLIDPGYIGVDFADIKAVLTEHSRKQFTRVGLGLASGKYRAEYATEQAFADLPMKVSGVRNMIVSVTASEDSLSMAEYDECMKVVYDTVSEDTDVIAGVSFSDSEGSELWVHITAVDCDEAITN